jgi:hypothetical protein
MIPIPRPSSDSISPHHAGYISQVPEGDLVSFLEEQENRFTRCLSALEETQGDHRYEPGKWSLKEVLGHMNDTERIFCYRLLSFARGESQSLPGFEQDDYVASGRFHARSLSDLVEEFRAIRHSSLALLKSLDAQALDRSGVANNKPLSVRGLAYLIAGHAEHHFGVIQKRYLA